MVRAKWDNGSKHWYGTFRLCIAEEASHSERLCKMIPQAVEETLTSVVRLCVAGPSGQKKARNAMLELRRCEPGYMCIYINT